MGVRFSCHGCRKPLNIKNELAGRRGVCPECGLRFRIPKEDADFSVPLEEPRQSRISGRHSSAGNQGNASHVASDSGVATLEAVQTAAVLSAADAQSVSNDPLASDSNPVVADPIASAIDDIATDDSATWYVRPPSGGQYGPANGETLKSWIVEGRVARNALLWRDGWPQWREASEAMPQIADSLPGGSGELPDGVFNQSTSANTATANTATANTATSGVASSPVSGGAIGGGATGGGQDALPSALGNLVNAKESVELRGNHDLGATRRKRSSRRAQMVAVLAVLVIGLIVTLVLVATNQNSGS